MSAKILDGKALATDYRNKIKEKIQQLGLQPCLAVILVGDDQASQIYVSNKQKACAEVGIQSQMHLLPEETSQETLLKLITELNLDSTVSGILLQLPLPKHINKDLMLMSIDPKKDVDGFHPINLGKLAQGHPTLRPCTPYGVMEILKTYEIPVKGKEAVIIGSSLIVGRPMAFEMLNAAATVTICHSATTQLEQHAKRADILISATGRPHLIQGNWVKPGAVVIDIGINRLENGKIIGDVDFATASNYASWITPVPGGVGPMTVTMLLHNTLQAALIQSNANF